jgi:hypothetical protein
MRSLACVLVVAALANVHAQPAPDLTKEFQAGVDAFRLGKFDEAKAHLEKARAIDPKLPGPHRFLAAVAQAQGKFTDCIAEARQALIVSPLSPEAPETRKLHDECRTSSGRAPYRGELGDAAAIAVVTNIPGATVKINGLTFGATPLAPRQITAGKLELEIGKPGWKPASVAVEAPSGIVTDVVLELDPDPNAKPDIELGVGPNVKATNGTLELPAAADKRVDGAVVTQTRIELAPGPHELELTVHEKDPWRRRVRISAGQKLVIAPTFVDTRAREHTETIGLAVVGGGCGLLVIGFLAHGVAVGDDNDVRDWSRAGSMAAAMHTAEDIASQRDGASNARIVRDVALGAGIAAIGVGAYFLYKGERLRSDVPPPFYVAPSAHGAVVGKAVRW